MALHPSAALPIDLDPSTIAKMFLVHNFTQSIDPRFWQAELALLDKFCSG
jgi:hypothetical protein